MMSDSEASAATAAGGAVPTATPAPSLPPATRGRVLVVDDEAAVRTALSRFLRANGYEVDTVATAAAALTALAPGAYAAMLCDVRLPEGESGLDLVPRALAADPDLAIVMLSGVNDAATAAQALTTGAMDYLVKPADPPRLQQAIERALQRRTLAAGRRDVDARVREEVALRTEQLEREQTALRSVSVQVAEALVAAMEAKDVYLRGRSQRVSNLAASIATELHLDDDDVEDVGLAGRLADVGLIGIREAVLNKPGKLTPEEYDHVKSHVEIGLGILAPLRHLERVLCYVSHHHERWDGTGYPHRLAGEAISLGGRILAAADAYDAVTSARAYRGAMPPDTAVDYLATHAGALLDPRVYQALRRVVKRGSALVFLE